MLTCFLLHGEGVFVYAEVISKLVVAAEINEAMHISCEPLLTVTVQVSD